MKINNVNNNIYFGKKLAAKAAIVGKFGSEPCSIYKLSLPEDAGYYYKMVKSNPDWAEQRFVAMNMKEFFEGHNNKEFFVLEDANEKGIGYITIENYTAPDKKKNTNIEYLETCPVYISQQRRRDKKYIGETLLAFITAKAKREKKFGVRIPAPTSSAVGFYKENCGFANEKIGGSALILHSNKFDTFVRNNARHTDCKVELIG